MTLENIYISIAIIVITLVTFIFSNLWKRYIHIIASEKFFICSLLATGVLIVLGTLIIQLLPEDKYASLYGVTVARILIFLEFDNIFHSKIFIFTLTCLGTSSLCNVMETLRCYRLISMRTLDGFLPHIGIIIILLGGLISEIGSFKGIMDLHKDQNKCFIQLAKENKVTHELPFCIYLDDFSLNYYDENHEYRLSWYILDRETGRYHLRRSWNNNALKKGVSLKELSIFVKKNQQYSQPGTERFFIIGISNINDIVLDYSITENYILLNDGLNVIVFELSTPQIKEYVSTIYIMDKNNQKHIERVKVNHPVKKNGYWIYQFSYKAGNEAYTTLQIVYDPGWKIVLTGIILLVSGTMVACFRNLITLRQKKEKLE